MKKIKQLIIISLCVAALFVFKDWLRTKIIVGLGGYTTIQTDTITDTKYIKGTIDTLAVFKHYVTTNGTILNPKPKIIYRTKTDTIKKFIVKIKDSVIDGSLTVKNNFRGDLVDAIFKYKPLYPKYLKRVDTLKTFRTVTRTLTNKRTKIGVGLGYNASLHKVQFLGSYTTKKDWQFIYEITPGKNIRSSIHSVKFMKHF